MKKYNPNMEYKFLEDKKRKVLFEPLNPQELASPFYRTCVSSCGHCRFCADSRGPISLKVDIIKEAVKNYQI